jgi:hypothetical protein
MKMGIEKREDIKRMIQDSSQSWMRKDSFLSDPETLKQPPSPSRYRPLC